MKQAWSGKMTWVQRSIQLALVMALMVGLMLVQVPLKAQAATIPTFSILKVVTDDSVTIRTYNFPANMVFTARMGKIGTRAVGGIVVGNTDSGKGGSMDVTYKIPAELKGLAQIAIRLDGKEGYYAYNWFYNNTSSGGITTPGYSGYPTFSITAVVKDDSVTIKTSNLPAERTFTVLMGKIGTRAVDGVEVGKLDSGKGGALEATYKIPASLKGLSQIAIRIDSAPYYAYNWFYNSSTSSSGGTGTPTPALVPGYSGYPTFSIIAVDRDQSVTIRTKNLPPNVTFTVRMGKYGTAGVGGTQVTTTDSGTGGTIDVTYLIPDGLKGLDRIAIRLESSAGYYAYNWFWNNDAP